MGYTVRYGPTGNHKKKAKKLRLTMPIAVLAVMLSMTIAAHAWPEQTERLRLALFPWERESVRQAFVGFRQDLQEGETMGDAITAFCVELLDEAEYPQ